MRTDVLILGGGPAGAAAAIHLARQGREAVLVERDASEKHKVCGEFLSAEALHLLARLAIDLPHESQAINKVRLASPRHLTEAQLPFQARSLTRRCLDTLLLHAAKAAGVTLLRGVTAESLNQSDDGWQATLSSGQVVTAARVILATGKHDLRGFARPRGTQNDLLALKMYWQLAPAASARLQSAVELHLHPQGYTGLQLVEEGAANCTALVRKDHLVKLGGWSGLLAELQHTNPHMAERLRGAQPMLDKPLALSAIPYGFVRRRAIANNLYAVGDQAAVIPSFTGDGMSIALFTGLRAAASILAGQSADAFQTAIHDQLRVQVARATALSRALVNPLLSPLLSSGAHLWPAALRHTAALTRLPQQALNDL